MALETIDVTDTFSFGIKRTFLQQGRVVVFQFPDDSSPQVLKACYDIVSQTAEVWPQGQLYRALYAWPRVDNMGVTPYFRRVAEKFLSEYTQPMRVACLTPPSVMGQVLRLWLRDLAQHAPAFEGRVFISKDEALVWLLR